MEVIYRQEALADIEHWKRTGDKAVQAKITALIRDMCQHPFTGLGKPEPLRYELSGLWSRRINREHRIIYEVVDGTLYVLSLKGHY